MNGSQRFRHGADVATIVIGHPAVGNLGGGCGGRRRHCGRQVNYMHSDPAGHDAPSRPHRPVPQGPQFGLRAMLLFTTGLCVVFAILSALGVAYWQTLLGFGVLAVFSIAVIFALEVGHRFVKPKPARDRLVRGAYGGGHRGAGTVSNGSSLYDSNGRLLTPDPAGIDFVDPEGINFVATEPREAELLDPPAKPLLEHSRERGLDDRHSRVSVNPENRDSARELQNDEQTEPHQE